MRRSTALGYCEVLVLGSLHLTHCIGAGLCSCICTAGERHHCTSARQAGEVPLALLCLAWVAIAMLGSEPVWVALLGLLASLQFLQGLKDFASQHFLMLPTVASAGLHSDSCFVLPQALLPGATDLVRVS